MGMFSTTQELDPPMQSHLPFTQFWCILGKRRQFDTMQFDTLCLSEIFFFSAHLGNSNIRRIAEIFMLCF